MDGWMEVYRIAFGMISDLDSGVKKMLIINKLISFNAFRVLSISLATF